MKRKKTLTPARADITSEQLKLSPEKDGISGIPAISHGLYTTNWQAMPEHIHEGCIELCFCSRGSLVFECEGKTYTLMPDNVFLTQPGDRHHLTTNHKGMRMYWLFFRYPRKGGSVLGLPARETAELVSRLKAIDAHDFAVDHGMRQLFRDIFKAYEELPHGAYRTLVLRTLILSILIQTIKSAGNRPSLKTIAKISDIAKMISRRSSAPILHSRDGEAREDVGKLLHGALPQRGGASTVCVSFKVPPRYGSHPPRRDNRFRGRYCP